ncbi:hypothetical protein [Haloferula sp. BvORR071]|uniref:hypothetical protein n=1 Tax=Haloferula sp. BvORR071 TaxID=1396141 RepID=UPI000555BA06|nr:hypothetical protein [Haloferula sp. BvORR071]
MKSFLHAFRLTFRRFRWEILAFWILSAWLVTMAITHPPSLDIRARGPRMIPPDFAKLEVLAACWLVIRLALSEPVFLTQGGWRTRPISRWVAWGASFAVLALALLPALLVRVIALVDLIKPDAAVWKDLFQGTFLWGALIPALAAIVVRLAGGLLWGRQPGPARRVVCGIFAVLAVAAWFHPATARFLYVGGDRGISWSGGGGIMNYSPVLQGLREKLPADAKFQGYAHMGLWGKESDVPRMRELFRVAPVVGTVIRSNGLALEILRVEPKGKEVAIDIEFTVAQSDRRNPKVPILLLHFPGNNYSLRQKVASAQGSYSLYALPLMKARADGSYESPEDSPDWDKLLPQLELVAFSPDESLPRMPYKISEEDIKASKPSSPQRPKKELPPVQPGLAGAVTEVFNGLDHEARRTGPEPFEEKAKAIPREGMPHVLARHPWSDASWEFFVQPFLLKHADESDKPVLLERMTTEPRLGEIFIAKCWKAEALPLLKRFAHDRLPLDTVSVTALLEEKDPALAADLAALAQWLPGDLSPLEARLREYPGLDWPAFVRQGWKLRKYAYRMKVEIPPFDLWAAQVGDATAFQYVAEKAARHESGYEERLRSLVAGQPQDAVAYVRTNLGKMKYDAATKTWSGVP